MRAPAWHDRADYRPRSRAVIGMGGKSPCDHRRVPRSRIVTPALPAEVGRKEGLAYALWQPSGPLLGGIVIVHGAGSAKENHHDFARVAIASGFAAVTFDQRGHGESDGPMDGRALDDVVAMASLLRTSTGDPGLQVPVEHSRELIAGARGPGSRLIAVPGGHHRSIQHDEELQGESLRFVGKAFAAADRPLG